MFPFSSNEGIYQGGFTLYTQIVLRSRVKQKLATTVTFNPNVGGLFRGLLWGGGRGGKINPPCLKPVSIMLETSNLACKYKHLCGFRKYTFYYQEHLNFADVSIFCKKSPFFGKNSTFTQNNIVRAVLKIF